MRQRRRGNPVTDFLSGFNGTYNTVNRVLQDMDMRDIATAKPETDTGYSQDQGDQLNTAAASGQYDIGYDQEKSAYTVTPKAGGETGTLSPVSRMSFLGKTYDKPLTESQQDQARLVAMAGVHSKFGDPAEALRLKQQARQGELTDLQLKGAQRQDAREQRDDDFRTRTQKLVDQWNGGLFGEDGKPRDATAAETLDLGMQLAKLNAEYGKGNPLDLAAIQKQAAAARDEGMAKAAAYLHMTGDVAGAEKIFNASGMQKVTLDPKSLQKVQMKIGGHSVPSYAVAGSDASGNPFRIGNTWGELVRGMTTAELAGMPFKVEELDLKRQHVGLEGARVGIAQKEAARADERWKIERPQLQSAADIAREKPAAAAAIYKQNHPGATPAELDAVRTGVMHAIQEPKPDQFTTTTDQFGANVTRTNKSTGAVDIIDPKSGKTISIAPPGKTPAPKAQPSDADIKYTAQKYGVSEDEVRKRLGLSSAAK